MAKNDRFPSDANKKKMQANRSKVEVMPDKPAVEGKAVPLVQVHFKKKHQHHLDHVWALMPGLNHIPAEVWDEAKKHPSIVKFKADGDLVDGEEAEASAELEAEESKSDELAEAEAEAPAKDEE